METSCESACAQGEEVRKLCIAQGYKIDITIWVEGWWVGGGGADNEMTKKCEKSWLCGEPFD